MIKKIRIYIVFILLISILGISSIYFFTQTKEDIEQERIFEELENIVQDVQANEEQEENEETEKQEYNKESAKVYESKKIDLQSLYEKNNDFVGWLKIENTRISYPVMQTECERKDYYLRKNFYKDYSYYGTPYIAEYCNILKSDNIIIYGHHINGNKMFGELEKYKNKKYYNEHKVIKFSTIYGEYEYEIIAVLKTAKDTGFKYYEFEKARTQEEYSNFISNCKELALYETGITAEYGNKLLTLSTCDYSIQNGRLVVVAKQIASRVVV